MRIWSIHPKYLDQKGLIACWRETLLAKHVLEGKTKGYKNHPQLIRFKNSTNPLASINFYLSEVYEEALRRNYNYSKEKIDFSYLNNKNNNDKNNSSISNLSQSITVTSKQLEYEWQHLLKKLEIRDLEKYQELKDIKPSNVTSHPIFKIVEGEIEEWEVI